jgi:hypothetical protein
MDIAVLDRNLGKDAGTAAIVDTGDQTAHVDVSRL